MESMDTPIIKQWLKIKKNYQDDLIFYRLGDFYELFYEDAETASRILNIQLTKKRNKDKFVPMAGVPFHSSSVYIKKLLSYGKTIVICEQVNDSFESKGLIERRVERVLTPATIIEDEFLFSRQENNLMSFYIDFKEKKASICCIDVSTSSFKCYETKLDNLLSEIKNIDPSEIITLSKFKDYDILKEIKNIKFLSWDVDLNECYHYLINHFKVSNLHSYNIENDNNIIRSAYYALIYCQDKLNNQLSYLNKIEKIEETNILYMDKNTKNNLDLLNINSQFSLFNNLDLCHTNMGSRLLYKWVDKPLNNEKLILERQEVISSLLATDITFEEELSNIVDIERILSRIFLLSAKPKDLIDLKNFLLKIPNIKSKLNTLNLNFLNKINSKLNDFSHIFELIEKSIMEEHSNNIKEGEVIKENYDSELDELRNIEDNIAEMLFELEKIEKEKTKIDKIKISYNKLSGFFIEVPSRFADLVPSYFSRKQTLKNTERFITEELKNIEIKFITSKSKALLREKNLYQEILSTITYDYHNLKEAVNAISELDAILSLLKITKEYNLTKPTFNSEFVDIKNGSHFVLSKFNKDFIPNDLYMNNDSNNFILTGANMGGKSTYMRQNAIIIILAQIGCFVPAEYCNIKIFNKIFTRIGASDNIGEGLSTFMVEMTETANILNNSDNNSFIILDEIGRGTSTYEGISIAWAVYKEMAKNIKPFSIFATHFLEITELEKEINNIKNICIDSEIIDGNLIFNHKVKSGIANHSYGIEVASIAGIPKNIIENSRIKLKELEDKNDNYWINKIDIDNLTPKQALELLYSIKNKI